MTSESDKDSTNDKCPKTKTLRKAPANLIRLVEKPKLPTNTNKTDEIINVPADVKIEIIVGISDWGSTKLRSLPNDAAHRQTLYDS